jgi:hypothetical protein
MPADRLAFARSVFETLSGQLFEHQVLGFTREEAHLQMEKQEQYNKLNWLAEESLRFLQLQEALDRPPEIEEFGVSAFANRSAALSSDVEHAWHKYAAVIEAARQTIGGTDKSNRPLSLDLNLKGKGHSAASGPDVGK